jgi:hypothetical protein
MTLNKEEFKTLVMLYAFTNWVMRNIVSSLTVSSEGTLFCTHCEARMDEGTKFYSRCEDKVGKYLDKNNIE